MHIEVAYARPDVQLILTVDVKDGTTIAEAIRLSGVLQRFPEIDLARQPCGVFGKVRPLDYVLQPQDRIEIYRPLIADPKSARRRRAIQARR